MKRAIFTFVLVLAFAPAAYGAAVKYVLETPGVV